MSNQTSSSVLDSTGKTRLQASLERAKRGEGPSIGQWLAFPGYSLARTVASLGEDWVLVDTEHGNIDDSDMYIQVGAVSSSGASPIVRIAASEPWMIKRALDCGAHAIMVPFCETKEQAEAIVRASKYPCARHPTAARGTGALFAQAAFNQTSHDYVLTANTNVLVCVQIETRTAVENVEVIAAVDGIDMLFIGPNDLASSMGYVPFEHAKIPEVQEATARVLRAGCEAGKYVGHFTMGAEEAARRVGEGFHFVNCGADVVAVAAWMSTEMGRLKVLVEGKKGEGAKKE